MFTKLLTALHKESLDRVLRTFLIAFSAITIPGVLGWLHDLTDWANGQGQTPFPDAHSLGFLAVSGITAGTIALVNLVWVYIEDLSGHGVLRDPAADATATVTPFDERGHLSLPVNIPLYVAASWLLLLATAVGVPWLAMSLL